MKFVRFYICTFKQAKKVGFFQKFIKYYLKKGFLDYSCAFIMYCKSE